MVLPTRDVSETSLSSVAELIEDAFGIEGDRSYIDFHLLHALLLIISKGLSILERKVMVTIRSETLLSSLISDVTITSVKVTAQGEKKRKSVSRKKRHQEELHEGEGNIKKSLNERDQSEIKKSRDEKIKAEFKKKSRDEKGSTDKKKSRDERSIIDADTKTMLHRERALVDVGHNVALATTKKGHDEKYSGKKKSLAEQEAATADIERKSRDDKGNIDQMSVKKRHRDEQEFIEVDDRKKSRDEHGFSEKSGKKKSHVDRASINANFKSKNRDGKSGYALLDADQISSEESVSAVTGAKRKQASATDEDKTISSKYKKKHVDKEERAQREDHESGSTKSTKNIKTGSAVESEDLEGSDYKRGKGADKKRTYTKTSSDHEHKDISRISSGKKGPEKSFSVESTLSISSSGRTTPGTTESKSKKHRKLGRRSPADANEEETFSTEELYTAQRYGAVGKRKKPEESLRSSILETESSEIYQESIIIVEKGTGKKRSHKGEAVIPESLVTKEQFINMVDDVVKLQERFGVFDDDTMALMKAFHGSASLSDPIAILQLSARLEVVEKALEKILPVIKELITRTLGSNVSSVRTTEINVVPEVLELGLEKQVEIRKVQETEATLSETAVTESEKPTTDGKEQKTTALTTSAKGGKVPRNKTPDSTKDFKNTETSTGDAFAFSKADETTTSVTTYSEDGTTDKKVGKTVTMSSDVTGSFSIVSDSVKTQKLINHFQLRNRLIDLEKEITQSVAAPAQRAQSVSELVMDRGHGLMEKLEAALSLNGRMASLEKAVGDYSEKINALDAEFSKKMTSYHDELSLMQYNLDITLDNMADELAHRESDVEAIADLNARFTTLQIDLQHTRSHQQELQNLEKSVDFGFKALWKQIQILEDQKSNRDEVTKELSTKAGLLLLNGKVSLIQFDAVCGDIQKQVASAYQFFNSQESIWQKLIDQQMRHVAERADKEQEEVFEKHLNETIDMVRKRIDFMLDVCGKPVVRDNTRQLRVKNCLSCSTHVEEADHKAIVKKTKEDGSGDGCRPCVPYQPIPHPVNKKGNKCSRYCHTLAPMAEVDSSKGIHSSIYVKSLDKEPKLKPKYKEIEVPCIPCNKRKRSVSITPTNMYSQNSGYNLYGQMTWSKTDSVGANVMSSIIQSTIDMEETGQEAAEMKTEFLYFEAKEDDNEASTIQS